MDDAPMLQSYVNNRLLYGLALKEENQMLNGDGTGDNLEGLNKVATAYDTSLNAPVTPVLTLSLTLFIR
jgi:HK97 family phage major capsid protein